MGAKENLLGMYGMTTNDAEHKYYSDYTAEYEHTLNDASHKYLDAKGVPTGTLNDRWFMYWQSLGYTGSFQDLQEQFWAQAPSFDVDFTRGKLRSDFVFSRASNATQFDSQGRLVWAPANLLRNSGDPTAAGWGVARASMALDASLNSPVGAAYQLIEDTTAANTHAITQTPLAAFVLNASYTFSGYFKANSRQFIGMLLPTGAFAGAAPQYFDLINGTAGATAGGFSAGIVDVGDGWYRCWTTGVCTSAVSGACILYTSLGVSSGDNVYTGDGVSNLFMSACQVERTGVDSPKPYVPSFASEYYGPRFDYNPATLTPMGFIAEEARTNIQPDNRNLSTSWQGSFVSFTDVGTLLGQAAVTLTTSAGVQFGYPFPSPGVTTASTSYTSSIVVKRGNHPRIQFTVTNNCFLPAVADAYLNYNFDTDTVTVAGSVLPTGGRMLLSDGAVRLWLTYTTGTAPTSGSGAILAFIDADAATRLGGTATVGATVIAGFGQCELGAWMTSIIPTFGVLATRSSESLYTLSVPNWYTDTGTFVVDFFPSAESNPNNRRLFLVAQNGAYSDVTGVVYSNAGTVQGVSNSGGGATDFDPGLAGAVKLQRNSFVLQFNGANTKVSLNGSAILAGAGRTVPTPGMGQKMWICGYSTSSNNVTGLWISRIRFFPITSFTDAQLQALTS